MRSIVYYVASSIDGFIAGSNEDISGFIQEGDGVNQYLKDLQDYDTVIMGRKTYEFGYQYGLKPGQLAYPHMEHHIFSNSLELAERDPKLTIHPLNLESIDNIRSRSGSDIYLCGGGQFAGWLLENQRLDWLKLKINPLILGSGVPLFGNSKMNYRLKKEEARSYQDGLQIVTYKVKY